MQSLVKLAPVGLPIRLLSASVFEQPGLADVFFQESVLVLAPRF